MRTATECLQSPEPDAVTVQFGPTHVRDEMRRNQCLDIVVIEVIEEKSERMQALDVGHRSDVLHQGFRIDEIDMEDRRDGVQVLGTFEK